jgi:isoleucyl-tRNA synthetase
MFKRVDAQVDFAAAEREVVAFWREAQVFARSVEQRAGAPEFVFYDGPPFATGLPHYGHLLAGTIKDVVPRYQTMIGKRVDRVFGWDCHGLPVENEMEKELGINSKSEIEAYGVDKFNEACRSIVLRYTREWERIVERTGRWVDFRRGYRTMDRSYMESIWWVFRQLWDKGLIYEGHKIMWYCPRCATPLANFEVNQGYVEVEDPALTVRFKALGPDHTYFLAWTTTPWTLPANLALTVGPDIDYVEVNDQGTHYLLGAALLKTYWPKQTPEIVATLKGRDLIGRSYEPLFADFAHLRAEGAFRVIGADFVSTAEGTGIVHTAPGFGEDDNVAALANGVPVVCPIDQEARYTAEVPDYQGRFVKDCDPDIIKRLKTEGKLVHRGTTKHNYPHCWRCDAPLVNKAIATWFVRVERLKERMLAANRQIHWVPGHLQEGRFGKWLENARDWAISRNRYWGCPLPIWRNQETGELVCLGSVAELEQRCGHPVDDLHKHFMDRVVLPGAQGGELRRVPEVLDCWFESGAMPYAQHHYPFEHKDWFEAHFPADFIAEGLDQTRGWFYTLVVLGAALFDRPAFRNVVVNGMVLAADGRKMSKRLKNYPDPELVMDTYGADALRLTLLTSPAVRADDLCFSDKAVQEVMRSVILPLWHSYSFFVTYALVDGWEPTADQLPAELANPLDRWIVSRLEGMVEDVRASMDAYELQPAATRFAEFIDQLTNWYIRRSRRRFWKSQDDEDKAQAYATLYHVLLTFCQAAAPFIPFITESIYRNLRRDGMPDSVHLCDYPHGLVQYRHAELDRRMARAQTAVSLGRFLRTQAKVRVRQPLREVILVSLDAEVRDDLAAMQDLIQDELNVKTVTIRPDEEALVHLSAKANFKKLGRQLGKQMKAGAAAIEQLTNHQLHELRHGGSVALALPDGTPLTVTLEDIELRREEKAGLAVANEGAITVALDIALDDELRQEGGAREFVHAVQALRKDAGLEVADRIAVTYSVPEHLAAAIARFREYIAGETLAVTLEPATDTGTLTSVKLGDDDCGLAVRKV